MTTSPLISAEALKEAVGYQRAGDLERWLRDQGVAFLMGPKGPVTTLDAVNQALGIDKGKSRAPKVQM